MRPRAYILVTSLLFFLFACTHGFRLIMRWEMVVNGTQVPMWVSWVAVFAGYAIAYQGVFLLRAAYPRGENEKYLI